MSILTATLDDGLTDLFLRYRERQDGEALGELFRSISPQLLAHAYLLARDHDEAHDLVQQTFVTVIDRADDFDTARRVLPWVLGILSNHGRALWRSRLRLPRTNVEPDRAEHPVRAGASEAERVLAAIEQLPHPYREVLRLRYVYDVRPIEISTMLERPINTVRSQLKRGMQLLRRRVTGTDRGAVAAFLAFPLVPERRPEALCALDELRPAWAGSALLGAATVVLSAGALLVVLGVLAPLLAYGDERSWSEPIEAAAGGWSRPATPSGGALASATLRARSAPAETAEHAGNERRAVLTGPWRRLPTRAAPPPRVDAVMTTQTATAAPTGMLHGGVGAHGVLADTWIFDGSEWREVTPAAPGPARFEARLAYDEQRGVAVLFGGLDRSFAACADTWEWDTRSARWALCERGDGPGSTSPPGVLAPAMCWGGDEAVVFGGADASGRWFSDQTWSWDGRRWRAIPTAAAPPPLVAAAMAYHAASGLCVLFGGLAIEGDRVRWSDATWLFDPRTGSWREAPTAMRPPPRVSGHLVYDPRRERLVLIGGDGPAQNALRDTWEFDGEVWSVAHPRLPPEHRYTHDFATCYLPGHGVVRFGGAGASPDAPADSAFAYDGNVFFTCGRADQDELALVVEPGAAPVRGGELDVLVRAAAPGDALLLIAPGHGADGEDGWRVSSLLRDALPAWTALRPSWQACERGALWRVPIPDGVEFADTALAVRAVLIDGSGEVAATSETGYGFVK